MFFYVIMFLLCFVLVVFFSYFLPNQNNPTAVWLRLIGMHNEKTWLLKIVKNGVLFLQMNSSYVSDDKANFITLIH